MQQSFISIDASHDLCVRETQMFPKKTIKVKIGIFSKKIAEQSQRMNARKKIQVVLTSPGYTYLYQNSKVR